MKILLAVDGSHFSLAAADAVAARVWPPETIVRIVHANESNGGRAASVAAAGPAALFRSPYAIEKALGRFAGRPLRVEAKVLHGRPKTAIVDEARAWGADLIVLGSQGMSGMQRFLTGSVSLAVATHADCSVEIIRPKWKSKQEE